MRAGKGRCAQFAFCEPLEGETEITFHQRSEAKFADAKETSRDQCVEDSLRYQIQTATQHSQIVIGTVQDNFPGFQRPIAMAPDRYWPTDRL